MGGGEPDPLDTGDSRYLPQQSGKIRLSGALQPVGVDVLAEEGNLLHPLCGELADLLDDLHTAAAHLAPPHVGNDAVGTEVVAPLHDGDEPGNTARRIFD